MPQLTEPRSPATSPPGAAPSTAPLTSNVQAPLAGNPTAARPAPPPRHAGRRRKLLTLGIIIAAIIVIGGACYYLYSRQYESTDDAFIDGDIVPIGARVAGTVKTIYVLDNQQVAAGQPLVQLDPRDYQTRLDQAGGIYDSAQAKSDAAHINVELTRVNTQAALAQAQAGVEQANAGVKSAEAQLASAQADVSSARAESTRRQADLRRFQALDVRNVSQQELDAAKASADAAAAQLLAAEKHSGAAEAMVAVAKAKVDQAAAALKQANSGPRQVASASDAARDADAAASQAKAAWEQARLDLSYTTILAPVAGRVARKAVEPGQYLQVGQSLCAIVRPDVWVVANFKETQINHMRRGQRVTIEVDAYPGKVFHGSVDSIQPGTGARFSMLPPENATGNYVKVVQRIPVKILLKLDPESQVLLAPGMSVTPNVRISIEADVEPAPITAAPETATLPAPETDTAIPSTLPGNAPNSAPATTNP